MEQQGLDIDCYSVCCWCYMLLLNMLCHSTGTLWVLVLSLLLAVYLLLSPALLYPIGFGMLSFHLSVFLRNSFTPFVVREGAC